MSLKEKPKKHGLDLSMKGLAMGIAEVIPGVSGGTIAFITGIYEELLYTIKRVNVDLFMLLKSGNLKALWQHINGRFLLFLLGGMAAGVIIGIFFVTYLLEHYPEPLWAFFFGLVLASGFYMARQISSMKPLYALLFFIGLSVSYTITQLTPAGGSDSFIAIFFSGAVAISALILPGISGSFILLLLGMYSIIIPSVKGLLSDPNLDSLTIVAVFAAGCLLGLLSFSRILSYTFKNYRDQTLAVLTGVMLGSLPKIWPWRNPISVLNGASNHIFTPDLSSFSLTDLEHVKVLKELNVMPASYFSHPNTLVAVVAFFIGLIIILGFDFYQRQDNTVK